ncbi:papain family cysteine protease, putative [Ichthyophthirius multifiliis]|uniref:Papain family cysteine protease, putative n=1 Tax=Ichthyophthirius multifiliis TaxID=5932 RepID=G0QW63_ICHMU|nr:papain family cysteine protease, putative [Ichthyophthirius multifiliis]EGR30544.1 papain family cysteine protease, putative [Ichthyophthirius multifiliis]|eukprot:XP_004032131.1 papain family cysteine protease, putative [Ichthyophthirius multifiliis]
MNKTLILTFAGVALLTTAFFFVLNHKNTPHHTVDENLMALWQGFKATYGKKYADPDFEAYRIRVFAQNLKRIEGDETKGITQFMDLTTEEFKQTYLTLKLKSTEQPITIHSKDEPTYVDWVSKGKVTKVKNQGQCGSCWAFSTTGSVESALILAGKQSKSVDLSEQELVDCSTNYGNDGCDGGLMDYGFQYIIEKGLAQESEYPYTATDGSCQDTSKFKKVNITKFADVPKGNCNSLKKALAQQPVSIAVDAEEWQFYTSGILKKCGKQLDHGVLLVGFVQKGDDNANAWKVKNSWGPSWGEKGFIYLADGNTCGVCDSASYPVV